MPPITITGLTAARMIAMENATIISGSVVNKRLILGKKDGTTVDAGLVEGPTGPTGPAGSLTGAAGGVLAGTYPNPSFATPETPQTLPLTTPYSQNGVGYGPAVYYKNPFGEVTLEGLVMKSSAFTADAAFATLPVGYRPQRRLLVVAMGSGAPMALDITTAGVISTSSSLLPANQTYVSLNGIRFKAA